MDGLCQIRRINWRPFFIRKQLVEKYIIQTTDLEDLVKSLPDQNKLSLDIESNGFYHYFEKVCLIQLATVDAIYIVDPLSPIDINLLSPILSDESVEKIIHSADYDVRSLKRDWSFSINNLFDTSIAAAFIGSAKRGLNSVLMEYLNIPLEKDKKMQRADWSIRPLPTDLLKYASDDVRYLIELESSLSTKLKKMRRLDWVVEECKRLTEVEFSNENSKRGFLSVKGSGKLNEYHLPILKSIYEFREKEAIRKDVPPFRIFSDQIMVQLVSSDCGKISDIRELGPYSRLPASKKLQNAIDLGRKSPPITRPKNEHGIKSNISELERIKSRKRLELLKNWRNEHAQRLNLDTGLLWPLISLERLSRDPREFEIEIQSQQVRKWQIDELGDSLIKVLCKL